ncbi:diphthamide biosynthesis enzyme Dph2 [Fervidicoccus fontis]|uniref:2-(3-amino-3-carboxypropyl)histidine synthase n=1 Tax=Fervidicoccus fontis TaxID=683846 RepID=A0A2J6N2T3_9CREN|nr:diphthamide biosynthesis enzyme Dph2 [Fervidicoccus fontis]PMB75622.1 MAG: diphthamide biosynthesis enzyme Dph2 [Fervidicoccus fontis]HEW64120.1 diphthamide biosynthesis enzyme Dph2 [Fervidicoccus fontis]
METLDYDFNLQDLVSKISNLNPKSIILQFPDGFKLFSIAIADYLKKYLKDVKIYISAESTWGGCDIAIEEAKMLGAELIVHFGHTPYSLAEYKSILEKVPVIYVPGKFKKELSKSSLISLLFELNKIGASKPALVSTIQHVDALKQIRDFLNERGISATIPKSPLMEEGQIVGCDYSPLINEKNYDSVVVVSGGYFHAFGAGLMTMKPTIKIDPYTDKVENVTENVKKILKKRYATMERSKSAEVWGIIIGTRTGQYRPITIRALESLIKNKGKKYYLFFSKSLTINELRNIDQPKIDAYVVTSCPRIPIDDISEKEFEKPVLTPGEAFMVLKGELERYRLL